MRYTFQSYKLIYIIYYKLILTIKICYTHTKKKKKKIKNSTIFTQFYIIYIQ